MIQEILKNTSPERIEASFNRIWKCKQKAGLFDLKLTNTSPFDFEKTAELNFEIAKNCITKIKDNNAVKMLFDVQKNKIKQRLYKLKHFSSL